MTARPHIALVGERNATYPAHRGIEASLADLAEIRWVGTQEVKHTGAATALQGAGAVWCVPGSPYASTMGALAAIRWSRMQLIPFLGTCGGFQHALMEFARNVLGRDAAHAEETPDALDPVISRLKTPLVGVTARVVTADAAFAELVGGPAIEAEFSCSYGLNPSWESAFSGTGFTFVARDEKSAVRAFRLEGHPFFLGTLFQPERAVLRTGAVHPLIRSFVQVAGRTK